MTSVQTLEDHLNQHGSADAWKNSFIKRLGDQVKVDLHAYQKRAPYMFEETEDVDLKDLDTEEVEKLVFGRSYEVTDRMRESQGDDDMYEQDKAAVDDAIDTQLLKGFSEEFTLLAEVLDAEEGDLKQEIKDDDALSVSNLDLYLHSRNYDWKGEMGAYCSFSSFNLDPGNADELFLGLIDLRIPLADYLKAAASSIDDLVGEAQEMNDRTCLMWGLDGIDLGDPDEAAKPWKQHYEETVHACHEDFMSRTGLTASHFHEGAVIDPEDLLSMALDQNGQMDLYVHLTVDADAIANFGFPASRHDLGREKGFCALVKSGYLAWDSSPCSGKPYAAELLSPIEVLAGSFSVQSDHESNSGDSITFTAEDHLRVALYDEIEIKRRRETESARAAPLDPQIPADAACIEACRKHLLAAPWWSIAQAMSTYKPADIPALTSDFQDRPNQEDRRIAALRLRMDLQGSDAATDPKTLARIQGLLAIVSPEAIAWADDGEPTSTFEWACTRAMPLDILVALAPPSVPLDAHEAPVKGGHRSALMRAVDAIFKIDSEGVPNPKRLEVSQSNLAYLLDQGCPIPNEAIHVHPNSIFTKAACMKSRSTLDLLLERVQDVQGAESHDAIVETLLGWCTRELRIDPLPCLLDHGGFVWGAETLSELQETRLKMVPGAWGAQAKLNSIEKFESVFRAYSAKLAAQSAIRDMGFGPQSP